MKSYWWRWLVPVVVAMALLLVGGRGRQTSLASARPEAPRWVVAVRVDGRLVAGAVPRGTVGSALKILGVRLGPDDVATPDLPTAITPGETIRVYRVREETQSDTVVLPFATETRPDPSVFRGERLVLQKGHNGVGVVNYRLLWADGVQVSNQVIGEETQVAPQSEIIGIGTAVPEVVSRGVSYRFSQSLSMIATGYWADPSWSNGRTATGRPALYGVVAVDPRMIALGSRLYIPGYGLAVAGDTGGAIKGSRVDLCFNDGRSADNWGVRAVTVYVLD